VGITYSILGSCVSRDIADLAADPLPAPVAFFSRTKVQSVVSTPTHISKDVGLASAFQTRVVVQDHRKTALASLSRSDHPVVIDLIDERFGLLHTGSGLVTDSLYWRRCRLSKSRSYSRVKHDNELAPDGPFATAAAGLAKHLRAVPRVVIHEARWATKTVDGEPLSNAAEGDRRNDWLSRAYDVLVAKFDNAVRVTPSAEVVLADPEHRWGVAPFHYTRHYYDDVANKIRSVLGDTLT
jgi:hypothetical protein